MQIVRIVIFSLVLIYLVMAFVFVHITLGYQRDLKKSCNTLKSLFTSQASLFGLIETHTKAGISVEEIIQDEIDKNNLFTVNTLLLDLEKKYRTFLSKEPQSTNINQIMQAVSDNVNLIRNEVYRYNKLIDNLNVNRQSVIFVLFVSFLRLKEQDKL